MDASDLEKRYRLVLLHLPHPSCIINKRPGEFEGRSCHHQECDRRTERLYAERELILILHEVIDIEAVGDVALRTTSDDDSRHGWIRWVCEVWVGNDWWSTSRAASLYMRRTVQGASKITDINSI